MSVIAFTYEEVINRFQRPTEGNKTAVEFIKNRPQFIKRFERDRVYDKNETIDTYLPKYIARLFWYLYVANQTAYSLQYSEAVDFFEEKDEDYDESPIVNDKNIKVASELSHFNYNLFTNDGNYFCSDEWFDVLQGLIDHLDAKEIRYSRHYNDDEKYAAGGKTDGNPVKYSVYRNRKIMPIPGQQMAQGGLIVGKYYKGKDGAEYRFTGMNNDTVGTFIDSNGKYVPKDVAEFASTAEPRKKFGWFKQGGKVRDAKTISKIKHDAYAKVKLMEPDAIAKAWNDMHAHGISIGATNAWTAKEVGENLEYHADYLALAMYEKELTDEEYNKYFEDGGTIPDDIAGLLHYAYPVAARMAKQNGLILKEDYSVSDGGTNIMKPNFISSKIGDKIGKISINYFDGSSENNVGSLSIDTETNDVLIDFPNMNVSDAALFADGGNVKQYPVYWIQKHEGSKAPATIFETNSFDKEAIQKKFDEEAQKMSVGDILEYGKTDEKYFHPDMLTVERTPKGLYRWTSNGNRKYNVKYQYADLGAIIGNPNNPEWQAGGDMFAAGGTVKKEDYMGKIMYASTGVPVKIVDFDDKFGGRIRFQRTDELADGKTSVWKPVSYLSFEKPKTFARGGDIDSRFPTDEKGKYMLLGRMQSDVLYYLEHPNEKDLWSGSVTQHIEDMKALYNVLKVKPEWLSMEDILTYEKQMNKIKGGENKARHYAEGGKIEGQKILNDIADYIEKRTHKQVDTDNIEDGTISYSDRISASQILTDKYRDLVHNLKDLKSDIEKSKWADKVNVVMEFDDEWVGFRVDLKFDKKEAGGKTRHPKATVSNKKPASKYSKK